MRRSPQKQSVVLGPIRSQDGDRIETVNSKKKEKSGEKIKLIERNPPFLSFFLGFRRPSQSLPPPSEVSYLLCSLIKNPEEEDPSRKICTRCCEGGPLPPCSWLGNIVNKKPPRDWGVLSINLKISRFPNSICCLWGQSESRWRACRNVTKSTLFHVSFTCKRELSIPKMRLTFTSKADIDFGITPRYFGKP